MSYENHITTVITQFCKYMSDMSDLLCVKHTPVCTYLISKSITDAQWRPIFSKAVSLADAHVHGGYTQYDTYISQMGDLFEELKPMLLNNWLSSSDCDDDVVIEALVNHLAILCQRPFAKAKLA